MSRILRSFTEHEASIRRIIGRYFQRHEDIEDLTQETFLRGFAAETTMRINEPKAFLFRVARNLAISEVKKKARSTTDYFEDSGGPEVLEDKSAVSADAEIDGKKKLAALSMAIANLPESHREILLMRKVQNLKHKQIATRLNISVSSVEKKVGIALLLCNDYLRKKGYDLSDFGQPAQKQRISSITGEGIRPAQERTDTGND